jgi:hypothetical protein
MRIGMSTTAPPPGARWRPLAARLGVLAGAVALGLALQGVLTARLEAIAALTDSDVVAARRDLAFLMRAIALPVLALTAGLGMVIALSCRHALAEGRFPPTGARAWGRTARTMTGPPARRVARLGIGLGATLFVCSVAAGGLLWWMTYVLLLCRAT